jgi:hypothetical protein
MNKQMLECGSHEKVQHISKGGEKKLFSLHSYAPIPSFPVPFNTQRTAMVLTTTADGHHAIGEVRMAGSLLAALIKETGRRAKTHSEGLLLGATHALTVAVTDDATEATERTMLQMDVTGYVYTGCRDSFYQPLTGVVKQEKVAEATAGTSGEHVRRRGRGTRGERGMINVQDWQGFHLLSAYLTKN